LKEKIKNSKMHFYKINNTRQPTQHPPNKAPSEITVGRFPRGGRALKVQFVVCARLHFLNLIFVFQFTINFVLMIVIKNIFLRH